MQRPSKAASVLESESSGGLSVELGCMGIRRQPSVETGKMLARGPHQTAVRYGRKESI